MHLHRRLHHPTGCELRIVFHYIHIYTVTVHVHIVHAQKEEVVMSLEAVLMYIHNIIGQPPRRIHSYNAKEYLSAAVAAVNRNPGTHLRTTIPHNPEYNRNAENIKMHPQHRQNWSFVLAVCHTRHSLRAQCAIIFYNARKSILIMAPLHHKTTHTSHVWPARPHTQTAKKGKLDSQINLVRYLPVISLTQILFQHPYWTIARAQLTGFRPLFHTQHSTRTHGFAMPKFQKHLMYLSNKIGPVTPAPA